MFVNPEQLNFINQRLDVDTIMGYTYRGCEQVKLKADENQTVETLIFHFSQSLTPYFKDNRKNDSISADIALYPLGGQYAISEIAVQPGAITCLQFLQSLPEFQNNPIQLPGLMASIPSILDDRFFFNERSETFNLQSDKYLKSFIYGINALLGARAIILTMGTKLTQQ